MNERDTQTLWVNCGRTVESEACITWWSEKGHRVDVLIDTEDQRFMWIVKSADGKWSPGGDEPWPQALVDELAKLQERTP